MKYKLVKFLAMAVVAVEVIFSAPPAPAQDFGLIVNQGASLADQDYWYYSATALPWFAAPLGEKADLYLSGGATAEYEDKFFFIPEIYRFELTCSLADNFNFGFGRRIFKDGPGLVVNGLFDGASASSVIGGGQLDFGVFYTGLLYKKTAAVTISPKDQNDYYNRDVYFASRRITGGVNWEKTSIFDSENSFWCSALFQLDLNDVDNKIHSQYLSTKFAIPFSNMFNLECAAVAELLEVPDIRAAFAAFADMTWLFYRGRLSLGGRFSSGEWNDALAAFSPVTSEAQGKILQPRLSGIALVQAGYVLRLNQVFFSELHAAYLFRTDTSSFISAGLDADSDSPFLGGEFYLSFSWAPFSDLVFTLGGGAFFPQLGTAFADDAGIKYRVELMVGISL